MVPRPYNGLFEDDNGFTPEADYLNPETRQESACRLWAGFAIASVALSFTAVSLFTPSETAKPSAHSLVTPAQANLTEASVTPSQVDVRIAHALGTVENRLLLLESKSGDTIKETTFGPLKDWSAALNSPDLPQILHTAKETPTSPALDVLDDFEMAALALEAKNNAAQPASRQKSTEISILSHIVKTESISNIPHYFLPLPDDTRPH